MDLDAGEESYPHRLGAFSKRRKTLWPASRIRGGALGKSLGVPAKTIRAELENAYLHDWQSDPFSRGAYSYGKAGANRALQILSRSLENTLFFAGEATDTTGHNGTVHGAMASGYRAARQVLSSG